MKQITGSVQGQNVIIDKSVLPVQGTDGLYTLKLSYDDDTWGTVDTKIITFTNGGTNIAVEDTDDEEGVVIPWEVLQPSPTNCGFVTIGVIGYAGTSLKITTTSVYKRNQLIVLPEVLGLSAATTPTPDIYQRLTQGLADALAAAEEANTKIGTLSNLDTEDKSNLVAAINEVLNSGGGSGTVKSVNNIEPDENGNVALSANDVGAATAVALSAETSARESADSGLQTAINGKQATLTTAQLAAVDSGITSTAVGKISSNETAISTINGKIPAAASTSNQLADKNFVNSSVATNTANYISNNGQPFASLTDLQNYSGTVTNNDYAFVVGTDSAGNTTYTRYKYNSTSASWAEEYVLNNSSFTSDQWAAISSGITSTDVTKLSGIEAGAEVNDIDTIKVNGTALTPTNKAVDIAVPTKTSDLSNDSNFATTSAAIGTTETATITTWTALASSDPYDYQATVTLTTTIGANSTAELINDDAVSFATYGFAIGAVSGQNVTIYSIGEPSSSVSLKINVKG